MVDLKMVFVSSLVIIIFMMGFSETKDTDCQIRFNGDTIVYGQAGQKLICHLEKIDTKMSTVLLDTYNEDWLRYDPIKYLVTGTPEKDNAGRQNVSLSIQSNSCSGEKSWKITVKFVIRHTIQATKTDSCISPPFVKKPVNHIKTRIGEVYKFALDPMTFMDKEEGDSTELKISLKPLFTFDFADNFWLKLDETSLTLYGVPMIEDNVYVVSLDAMDSCQQTDVDSIRLEVEENNFEYNHNFIMYLGENSASGFNIYRFINGLVQWLEISDSRQIFVSGANEESRTITWVDKSLSTETCERGRILETYYQMADENGTILEEFSCFFSPFFNLSAVFVDFTGTCNISDLLPNTPATEKVTDSTDVNMYLLYIVIPVAALTIIILVAILIMLIRKCCKQNKYVMKTEKPIYLANRQPVIFQNEYNEDETNLKPQVPIVIDNFDDPFALVGELKGRSPSNPPSYVPPAQHDPPQYRLPPAYHVDVPTV